MPRIQLPDSSWETIFDPEDPEDTNRRAAVAALLDASTLTNTQIVTVLKLIIRYLIKRGFLN